MSILSDSSKTSSGNDESSNLTVQDEKALLTSQGESISASVKSQSFLADQQDQFNHQLGPKQGMDQYHIIDSPVNHFHNSTNMETTNLNESLSLLLDVDENNEEHDDGHKASIQSYIPTPTPPSPQTPVSTNITPSSGSIGNSNTRPTRLTWREKRRQRKAKKKTTVSDPYHTMTVEEVCRLMETNTETGLESREASIRLVQHGPNVLKIERGPNAITLLIKHLFNGLSFILVICICISFSTHNWVEGGVVLALLFLNTLVGYIQELQSENTLKALKKLSSPTARVIRDGLTMDISSVDVVVGDIVLLEAGDAVCADLRLFMVNNLQIDEALLTGEPEPVEKDLELLTDADQAIADRLNLAYSSCIVSKGRGRGVVVKVGMDTQIGAIAYQLKQSAKGTGSPMQKKLSLMTWILFATSIVLGFIVIASNGFDFTNTVYIVFAVSIGIAIVPESLIAVVTLAMSAGVRKMSKERAIVRRLNALEALGLITNICSDKTGTLTEAKMVATAIWFPYDQFYEVSGLALDIIGDIKPSTSFLEEFKADIISNPSTMDLFKAYHSSPVNKDTDDVDEAQDEAQDQSSDQEQKVDFSLNTLIQSTSDQAITFRPHLTPIMTQLIYCTSLCNTAILRLTDSGDSEVMHQSRKDSYVILQQASCQTGQRLSLEDWSPPNPHERSVESARSRGVQGVGDPTEVALQVLSYKVKLGKPSLLAHGFKIVQEHHFDSSIKCMSIVVEFQNKLIGYLKGAPERVLDRCSTFVIKDKKMRLDNRFYKHFRTVNVFMASKGLRVLAIAYRPNMTQSDLAPRDHSEQDYCFLGFIGIYDPPRPESRSAIKICADAGIIVHMATGDHPATATAIARAVGILTDDVKSHDCSKVMMAREFEAMTDAQIDAMPNLPRVLARCGPDSKVSLIRALHRRHLLVAMTGDGVNDAPALHYADIGLAMGQNGSEVARQASDIILTDDNFATITSAIRSGRQILDNIYKFIAHLMSGNVAEVITLMIGLSIRSGSRSVFPLSTLQILWLNLATSSPPAMALGLEKADSKVMDRPPVSQERGIFYPELVFDIIAYGTMQGTLSLCSFIFTIFVIEGGQLGLNCNRYVEGSTDCYPIFRSRSVAFLSLTLTILYHAINCKDFRKPVWKINVFDNKWIIYALLFGAAITCPLPFIPYVNTHLFEMMEMSISASLVVLGCLILFIVGSELYKAFKRCYLTKYDLYSWRGFIQGRANPDNIPFLQLKPDLV